MKRKLAIFDIDGTLLKCKFNAPSIIDGKTDWSTWEPDPDPSAHQDVINVLNMYRQQDDVHVALLTARAERHRAGTIEILKKHSITFDSLHMRNDLDDTPPEITKPAQVRAWREEGFEIVGVYEDHKRTCAAVREMGITVFQMAER